jgi:hypothetical protein
MTKHANPSGVFDNRSDLGQGGMLASSYSSGHTHLSEPELSTWAEQSTIAASGRSRFGHLGTLAFWTIVAGLLIARFFVVDPATLRPEGVSSSVSVSSTTPPKI